jgi:ribosome biogenesis protein Tsr3
MEIILRTYKEVTNKSTNNVKTRTKVASLAALINDRKHSRSSDQDVDMSKRHGKRKIDWSWKYTEDMDAEI